METTKIFNKSALARRVRQMKLGQEIIVSTEVERVSATNTARAAREMGVVNFVLWTRKNEAGQFVLRATKP